ncbi:G2/mitotic-specific cyclin [Dipsacomyces acuminosporus]|nr:G2/mitotic-specific cyclin [Dipsacomyces acuminosporus]
MAARAAAAAADNAIHAVLAGKSTNAIATAGTHHQPAKILRSQSASNAPPPPSTRTELGTSTAAKASCAQAASGEPLSLAGRKRRASSAEPAAATRAVLRPQSAATGEPSAFPPSSSSSAESCADSQATVVESEQQQQQKPPALAHRKIAKPSRTFASLHSNLGPSPFDIEVARPEPACDWDNIDADDADDPLMVSEYISDIIDYLRKLEQKTMPDETYMGKQVELSWEMRRVLVNWLIQIHYQLRMLPETLFLAVNLVDRFLSKRQVSVSKLQLVGLSGLLVACKYEEMTTPHIQDFAYLAGNCYSVEEIMNAEVFMLRVLDFDMSYPSPLTFLRRVSKAEQYNMQTRTVAKYLMEICLVDHRLMPFSPSLIAAAGICLARRMLKAGPWDANLRHYSGYTEEELQPCMRLILDHMQHMNEEDFLFKKYQHRRFLKASLFCREWISRHRHELQPISPPIGNFASSSASGGAF